MRCSHEDCEESSHAKGLCPTHYMRVWRQDRPPEYHNKSFEERRNYRLWNRYSLTPEQYDEILSAQNGHCAICPSTNKLTVDHDHSCCPGRKSCGECVRGILCDPCNRRILPILENSDLVASGLSYLNKWEK